MPTTRVKIKDFVASTKRYARKSARAADKDKSGRITRGESKALPKDLRDDFARQAGKKGYVGTEKFAADQAAYVEAMARHADADHDGVLDAKEIATLPE